MVRVISQETFDNAVKENMEVFDMCAEDAVKETIKQFEAQDVNLSNIIKDLSLSGQNDENREIIQRLEQFKSLASEPDLCVDLIAILDFIKKECDKDVAHKLFMGKYNVYDVLVDLIIRNISNVEVSSKSLETVISLMTGQPDLLDEKGIKLMTALLDQPDITMRQLTLNWIKISCIKHEHNRQNIFKGDILKHLKEMLKDPSSHNADTIKNACAVFRALVLDDDVRVEFGNAHEHAKAIASDTICPIMKLLEAFKTNESVVSSLMLTLAALLVRTEYCKKVQDAGGIEFILDTLVTFVDNEKLVRQGLKLLKALAGNDTCKFYIVEKKAAPIIAASIDMHKEDKSLVVAGLTCISALSLRAPENSEEFYKTGTPDLILDCMRRHHRDASVQKVGSWAIRNMVSRNKNQCRYFISIGAEDELNKALQNFEKECGYDLKSALRDLGCNVNLKEAWTGKGGQIHTDEKPTLFECEEQEIKNHLN